MFGHDLRPHSALATVLVGGLLCLSLTACGGSSRLTTKAAPPRGSATKGKTAGPGNTGSVKAVLLGQDHHPVANRNWTYTVHVADVHGRPLAGTLRTEFVLAGSVVGKDTPFVHSFSHGHYREVLKFPATAIEYPLELQVVVHTQSGSATVDWPVRVHK